MSAASPQQIKDLFDIAFDLMPEERDRFLAESCNGDQPLHAEVEKLLCLHAAATEFLEASPLDLSDPSPAINSDAAIGRRIGAYQVIRELGRGGMGAVFLAHRADQTFEKQVAIKLVWPGLGSEEIIQRFQQERQILARLEHLNIARLLDGGVTAEGWHYLVMEYVEGVPITQYCRQHSLPERLPLFRAVCEAVQFAHQNLVIHRDLKPGNILVTADGTPKLLDFGIAKLLETNEASLTLTHTQLPLTPEYASPEQLNNHPITTATDVYSLGVVLYEILTERKPYRFKAPLLHEVARVVCEREPDKPNLDDDLENIVLKALRKEPAARYSSVAQLSEDLRRYQAGETVLARKATINYRAGKFIRRHKLGFTVCLLLLLTLLTVLLVSLRQERVAQAQARVQRRVLYAAQMKQAMQDWQDGNLAQLRDKLAAVMPHEGEEDLRGFEWRYFSQLLQGEKYAVKFPAGVVRFAFAPDGKTFATGMADGTIILSEAATGKQLAILERHRLRVRSMAFSADGKLLVTGDNGGDVKLWDVAARRELRAITAHENKRVRNVAFAPDGAHFATASDEGTAKIWEVSTGQLLKTLDHADGVNIVQFTRDGKTLLTGGVDKIVRFWEVSTGRQKSALPGYGNEILDLALTPDEKFLAVGGLEHEVKLFDLTTRKIIRSFVGHTDTAWILALSPDGKMLAATSPARPARVWDVATGRELFTINAHDSEIGVIAFAPNGKDLVTCDGETLKVWDIQSLLRPQQFTSPGQCHFNKLAFSADGKWLAAGERHWEKQCAPNPFLIVWDTATGQAVTSVAQSGSISCMAFGLGENRLTLGRHTGFAEIWTVQTAQKLFTYQGQSDPSFPGFGKNTREILSLAIAPDGQLIATGDWQKTIKLWTPEGREIRTLRGPGKLPEKGGMAVFALAFSHDNKLLAVAGDDKNVELFQPQTGEKLRSFATESPALRAVQFSPDDRWLAAAGNDSLIRIWSVATGQLANTLRGHADLIYDLAWTPDGARLASASKDKTVRIWNPADGLEVLTFREHTDHVCAVAFSPDGATLASASWDGTIMIRRTSP